MDTNSFAFGILIALSACLANVSSQRESCLGNYCSGSFGDMKAICKDGYCYCTGQDYDYNTCLPDAYGCRIEVNSNASPAIPRYNNQQPSTVYSCTPKSSSSQYEVHVMSVYEGNRNTRPPSAGDTNVNIVSSNKSRRPIILVFGSYEPVNWIVNLPANITISKVILVAYYIDQSSVRGDMKQVQAVERKNGQWGMGFGSDTGGGDTVALLRQVHSLFGVVTSFTGTYKADHWSLTLSSQGMFSPNKTVFLCDNAGSTCDSQADKGSQLPTKGNAGQATQETAISNESIIYISSGIAFILLLVLCFIVGFWYNRRSHHKRIKRSSRSAREIIPFDKWELLPEQIEHKEELGRGAFGVVYKATLKRRIGIEVFDTKKTLKPEEPLQVVAVKELQDDSSEDQKEEFLHEIELMKLLGSHQNIVSLVGCCTLQEHKFLVIEYVPFGDLLQWLRRRRRSINQNQGTGGNVEKKCYEDKEMFSAQKEESECDQEKRGLQDENRVLAFPGVFQVDKDIAMSSGQLSQDKEDDTRDEIDQDQPLPEQTLLMMESTPSRDNRDIIIDATLFLENLAEENRNDLLAQEIIELMPISSTTQDNSNAAAILISTENMGYDDDDEEEGNNNFLDQEKIETRSMPTTSQGNINAATILISTENSDDDDANPDEGNCNDFLEQESMDQLSIPSTSLGNINAAVILISTENVDDDDDDEEADSFTTQKLFSFAWQIAKGMNHLAEKGFIHRDLAARNILVGSDNRVKVSDFGLMREIYEDVYSGKNTKKLPVKWMAPESINDRIYTIKSDVWSFGILLWEMATMGRVPYPTLTNRELCHILKTGYRMERPDMCCDEVYELMSECWNEDPSSRPSFSELIDRLEVIMTRDVPYCDLNKHDESRAYYNVPAKDDGHSG